MHDILIVQIHVDDNVLKTGPKRPVQPVGPGIGDESDWVNLSKPLVALRQKLE